MNPDTFDLAYSDIPQRQEAAGITPAQREFIESLTAQGTVDEPATVDRDWPLPPPRKWEPRPAKRDPVLERILERTAAWFRSPL